MPVTINGTTGITDADGGTVLSSADLATQAQAEAGTDNATLMTPLRVAQAVTAQSTALLGTINTTSGSSVSLSGLTLTGYSFLVFVANGVSTTANTSWLVINSYSALILTSGSSGEVAHGIGSVDLGNGVFSANGSIFNGPTLIAGGGYGGLSGVTTASTSITFTASSGSFDAGSIRIYGVR